MYKHNQFVLVEEVAMTNLAVQEHWNQVYRDVEPQIAQKIDPVRAWIEANIPNIDGKNKTCIEIGCYPGRYLSVFGELGYELFGIDLTDKLGILPTWLREKGYKVGSFWKMGIQDFDPKQKFDVVASFGFIEHFTNWDKILMKHMSFVKENGYLILEVPNFLGAFQHWVHANFDRANYERHCLSAMDIERWREILDVSQFDIIYEKYFGGFDFWTVDRNLTLIKKLFIKILKKLRRPLNIILPKDRKMYSPFCGVIARRRNENA